LTALPSSVEAVLDRYRAGIPWRDLPERFGAWKKVHTRFGRWARSGAWTRVFEHLAGDADNEHAMIDSTIVRAHRRRSWRSVRAASGADRRRRQHSAGAAKKAAATRRAGAAKAA
jgi:transposase